MAKILIVDDDPDFVKATSIVLESHGHQVISAANGEQGMARVREENPDLVILDIIMSSVLDGLYMSRELSSAGKRPPVIMMTSIANTDYAELFPTDEEIDIDRFLTKPVSPDRLIEEVDALLEKK